MSLKLFSSFFLTDMFDFSTNFLIRIFFFPRIVTGYYRYCETSIIQYHLGQQFAKSQS